MPPAKARTPAPKTTPRQAAGQSARQNLRDVLPDTSTRRPLGTGPAIPTPLGDAPVLPLLLLGFGAYLMWFAVHYWRDASVRWPTDPVKSVLQGKGVPGPTQTSTVSAELDADITSAATTTSTAASPAASTSGTDPQAPANMALGQMMAAAVGWTGDDWLCLKTGWEEESHWSVIAANDESDPYNHAYGIPQSNPGTKMASAGADWKTNPQTQITWGLSYIKEKYGSPSQVPLWTTTGPAEGYVGY